VARIEMPQFILMTCQTTANMDGVFFFLSKTYPITQNPQRYLFCP